MSDSERIPSPIDAFELPSELTARVVKPGLRPWLHGFDVHEDLSRHYSFAELVLIALGGEAPEADAGRAFEVALSFAAPIAVGEAPAHAAMLSRLCGARPGAVASVSAMTLAEQARTLVEDHRALFGWLEEGEGAAPEGCASADAPQIAAVARLRRALPAGVLPDAPLTLVAAVLAVFHRVGLRESWQLEAAWSLARWPVAIAEAMAVPVGHFRAYPMRLPDFVCTAEEP